MTSALAAIFIIVPILLFYSAPVEKNRIITIQRPMVITQERKTPAYYLYQQVQNTESIQEPKAIVTTYLSTQSFIDENPNLAVAELKVDRREIASDVDAGFQTSAEADTAVLASSLNEVYTIPQNTQTTIQHLSPSKKWATIRGKFELRDGVGVVDHIIELKRVEEGRVREIGNIDLKAGIYSIDIESPQGHLFAQITDRNGVVIGNGQQRLTNLQTRRGYVEGPFMKVGRPAAYSLNLPDTTVANNPVPSRNGARAAANAALEVPISATLFSDQHALGKPNDQFGNVSYFSSTISRITDQRGIYKTITSVRQVGDQYEIPMFTRKWIQGVIEYISDQQKIEFKSTTAPILMGRIYNGEKTLAGIQVQIENHPGIMPVYFDQFMIPNFKQTETSDNGYFMFLGLEDANYNVAAFKEGKMLGFQMYTTEEDAISYQNIVTSTAPRSVIARTFDAFSGQPLETDLIIPDVDEVIQTRAGTATYRTHNKLGVAQFQARVNMTDHVPARYFQDSRKDYVHIPMVTETWLRKMQSSKLINDAPGTGMILGFIPEVNFDVYLAATDYNSEFIVYFDSLGNPTARPTVGGGFIMFNVPIGTSEVIVQEKNSEKIFSQVLDVKINQVSSTHFSD